MIAKPTWRAPWPFRPSAAPNCTTPPPWRLAKEVKRCADILGIFPNEAGIIRPIGTVLVERHDDWQSYRDRPSPACRQIDAARIIPLLIIAPPAA
jgi:putative transposase